jgi:RNA polymerase sigma-70 factor (ECF subfamily)
MRQVLDSDLEDILERVDLEDILERVAGGDRVAFRELYRLAGPKLFGICRRMMRDREAAQDAFQDVMIRIWEKSHLFDRTKGEAMGWMSTLARNVVFNRLADRPAAVLSMSHEETAAVAESIAIRRDPGLASDLGSCLQELEHKYRRCVILVYHYGLSYEELAAHKGVPLGTIKTWIHRAIGQLQLCLSQ